jgi:hypothetical protein
MAVWRQSELDFPVFWGDKRGERIAIANLAVDAELVQVNGKLLLRVEAHAALAAF